MNPKRCGNCRHLDPSSATDIGGVRIARCRHPHGVVLDTTPIHNDYVELVACCSEHAMRSDARTKTGGGHA